MSDYEHWKGKMKEIKEVPQGTIAEQGKWLVEQGYTLDSFNEEDGYFYEPDSNVINVGTKWYKIIEKTEINEWDDICIAEDKGEFIEFELKYYNGGTNFSEMMEDAIRDMKKNGKQ